MKRHIKKYISPHHWLLFLRRQSTHMQHVYSAVIAGIITTTIAGIILYVDYGFWHEKYVSEDLIVNTTATATPESPSEMLSRFMSEAKVQLNNINTSRQELLKGEEIYVNTEVNQ